MQYIEDPIPEKLIGQYPNGDGVLDWINAELTNGKLFCGWSLGSDGRVIGAFFLVGLVALR